MDDTRPPGAIGLGLVSAAPNATMAGMPTLADESRLQSLVGALAAGIGETMQAHQSKPWALVGIRRRGDTLAKRLAATLPAAQLAGRVGSLDITLYRDDLSEIGPRPIVRITDVAFSIDAMNVVLVDDVLMTGRSIRAALQSLGDLGRPARIWLAILVDRGGRELPIAPDFVGLKADQSEWQSDQHIQVLLQPDDDRDAIVITSSHPTELQGIDPSETSL